MLALFIFVELAFALAVVTSLDNDNQITDEIPLNLTTAFEQGIDVYTPMPVFATSANFGKSDNSSSHRKKLITLIMSNSFGGEMPVGAISTKAMELALDRLRSQPNWLPNYDLALELVDDECVDSTTINRVVPLLRNNDKALNRFPLFLSPACEAFGLRTVVEVIKYYNFVGFSTIQTSSEPYHNRQRFSAFFSLGEQNDLPHIALAEFISRMGWRNIAILSEAFPYYDELEKTFLPLLDEKNVTVLWRGKVSHAGVFDDEMRQNLDEMIQFDPRIIVVDADRGAGKACWLHRYGLFGPNYVLFFFYWSDVYPTPGVPDNLAKWCTVDMINEVLANSFVLGDATITDTFGNDIADSTGITGRQWELEMESKLINPKDSPFWEYWRMLPYDNTLFAGYLLNTTETLLNQRYETLSDWVTSSKNFINNGHVISDILKQAIYSTVVTGLKGEYRFEKTTTVNSLGFTPVTITQMQRNFGNESEPTTNNVIVALYRSNIRDKFVIFSERIKWQSKDGLPTKDAIEIAMVLVPIVGEAEYAVLSVFAILVIFLCATALGIAAFLETFTNTFERFSRVRFHFEDISILIGNIVMLFQVFALPVNSHDRVHVNCILMAIFLTIGFSTSIYGILMKLENVRIGATYFRRAPFNANVHSNRFIKNVQLTTFLALWLAVQVALLSAFFARAPLDTKLVNMTMAGSRIGSAFVYQPFQYRCSFRTDLIRHTDALVILGVLAALEGLMLSRATVVASKLSSRYGRSLLPEIKNTTMAILCCLLIFGACALIAVLVTDFVYVIISVVTLCYVMITVLLCIFSKFIQIEEDDQATTGQHPMTMFMTAAPTRHPNQTPFTVHNRVHL